MRDRTIYVAKTKALISFAVTAKLICVFVFAYAKRWFSHDKALIKFVCIDIICDLVHNLETIDNFYKLLTASGNLV